MGIPLTNFIKPNTVMVTRLQSSVQNPHKVIRNIESASRTGCFILSTAKFLIVLQY